MNIRLDKTDDDFRIVSSQIWNVSVDAVNYDDDVALLSLKDEDLKLPDFVTLAPTVSFKMGDPVFAVGYPRGQEVTFTEGMFTANTHLRDMGVSGHFWKVTVPITGGSSGGGLYVRTWDEETEAWDYQLVGLATAGYRDVSFQNFFSTLSSLKGIFTYTPPTVDKTIEELVRELEAILSKD